MKNKHRIKQGLSLLLAGALTFINDGTALPAFAEDAPATPETASAATPETAEANVPTPNLSQITENLYADLPDAPTGSYLGSMGLPVATGETKIGISAWVSDLYDGVDAHMDADALNADENTVTIGKTPGTDYAIVPLLAQVEYPADGAVSEIILPDDPPTIQRARLRDNSKPRRKLTGLRALYYRYLYELGALPRKPRRPSYAVRQDAYKLDQRIRQMEFLSKNNIDTLAQLETYRLAKLGDIVQLTAQRKSLYKVNPDSQRIQQITAALKQLRQEERLCRKIAEQSLEVQQHLTEARRDRAEQQQREQEHERDRRPNIDLTL